MGKNMSDIVKKKIYGEGVIECQIYYTDGKLYCGFLDNRLHKDSKKNHVKK